MNFFNFGSNKNETKVAASTGKVVSLLNQKGGVGKTTMCFNIGHALARQNKKVLFLDMDPQANLTLLCNQSDAATSEFNIFHLLINNIRELKPLHRPVLLADLLKKSTLNENVDYIQGGSELSGFELTVAGINAPRQLILKKFIEKNNLLEIYDYIIIDGPPTLGLLVVNILCATNGILVPFQPDQFSRKGLTSFHEIINDISEMGITDTPKIIGYIPNLVEMRRKQVGEELTSINGDLKIDQYEGKLFEAMPNKIQLVKSIAQKKSVFDFQAKDYVELQEKFNVMVNAIITGL